MSDKQRDERDLRALSERYSYANWVKVPHPTFDRIIQIQEELEAANRKIEERDERDRLHAIEIEQIAKEITQECKDDLSREKHLELQIQALGERLRVATAALESVMESEGSKVIYDFVSHVVVNCPTCSLCNGTPNHLDDCWYRMVKDALAKLKSA